MRRTGLWSLATGRRLGFRVCLRWRLSVWRVFWRLRASSLNCLCCQPRQHLARVRRRDFVEPVEVDDEPFPGDLARVGDFSDVADRGLDLAALDLTESCLAEAARFLLFDGFGEVSHVWKAGEMAGGSDAIPEVVVRHRDH